MFFQRNHGASGTAKARQHLIQRFVDDLHQEPFQPSLRRKPYGPVVQGWDNRLATYFWPKPGTTWAHTEQLMRP